MNAPEEEAEIAPAPRARLPSQTTSALRSMRGTAQPSGGSAGLPSG